MRAALLFTLALSGCSSAPKAPPINIDAGVKPTSAEAETAVRQYLARSLKDPESLKQFAMRQIIGTGWSRGWANGGGTERGWLVCFEYNAKNSYGGYTGLKVDGIVLRDLQVLPVVWQGTSNGC